MGLSQACPAAVTAKASNQESWPRPSGPYLAWPMVLPGHPRSSSAPGAPPGPWEWRLRPIWPPGPQPTPSLPSSRAGGNHGRRFFPEKHQGGPVSHSCALSSHPPLAAGPPKPVEPGREPHTQPLSLCSHLPLSLPVAPTPATSNVPTPSARIYPVAPATHSSSLPSLPQMPTPNHPVCKVGPWPLALGS